MPRVTVIIPTYNWSAVLPYSIGSVLRQTFTDFELLVVGDGCTDDSETVVNAIGDPRIRWINLPNNGGHQAAPNNEGIRQAKGEIIAYLGHDDLWLADHLEVMVAALDAGADLVYGIVETIEKENGPPKPVPAEMGNYVPGIWIPPTGVIHRRAAALRVGGWSHFVEVDREPEAVLWEKIQQAGFRLAFVPRIVGVKISAGHRKDVYKTRPTHEQAAWSERMVNEKDFHTTELVKMLSAAMRVPTTSRPFTAVLKEFLGDLKIRVRRRVLGPPRIEHLSRQQIFNRRREIKGLDPKSIPPR